MSIATTCLTSCRTLKPGVAKSECKADYLIIQVRALLPFRLYLFNSCSPFPPPDFSQYIQHRREGNELVMKPTNPSEHQLSLESIWEKTMQALNCSSEFNYWKALENLGFGMLSTHQCIFMTSHKSYSQERESEDIKMSLHSEILCCSI